MITVDTNLLVRFAVRDDTRQATQVIEMLQSNHIHVSVTVLLETEWVLRSRYGYSREDFCEFVGFLLRQEQIHMEDGKAIDHAVQAHAQGMDFADALHCSRAKSVFWTFDRGLCNQSAAAGFDVQLLS